MAIFSRHGHDAVSVRVVERLLISGPLVLGLFYSVWPPSPATAEWHDRLLGRATPVMNAPRRYNFF